MCLIQLEKEQITHEREESRDKSENLVVMGDVFSPLS